MLGILKAIQEQIGKSVGDSIEVVVWRNDARRTVEIPAEFDLISSARNPGRSGPGGAAMLVVFSGLRCIA
jgi:hypothetical protein